MVRHRALRLDQLRANTFVADKFADKGFWPADEIAQVMLAPATKRAGEDWLGAVAIGAVHLQPPIKFGIAYRCNGSPEPGKPRSRSARDQSNGWERLLIPIIRGTADIHAPIRAR